MATNFRRITLPKLREQGSSSSYSNIQTDNGLVSTTKPDQTLNIVGGSGITVSATEGSPDSITIALDGELWYEDEYDPDNDQITFTLTNAPTNTNSVFFIINGVVYDDVESYNVSGQTVTWTNTLFNIESTDHVVIKYM